MDDCKVSCQNKYSTPQRMDDCHSYCDKKQIRYFKGWMAAIRVVGCQISRLPLKKLNA